MRFRFGGAAAVFGSLILALTPAAAPADALPGWADQIELLKGLGDQLAAATDREGSEAARQEMYRYVLGAISNGYLNYVNMDTSHPTWAPLWNYAYNYGGANPDYVYMMTFVDPKGAYRISGYRGTSRFVEIAQQTTDFTSRAVGPKPVPATHDLDSLHKDKDGYFSVIRKSRLMAATNPVSGQIYLDGAYEIGADEALILETPVPSPCRYWQILVTDNKFTTVDWVNRQSSLNGYQARIDRDGRFRAVISARDPGVPNWLDTAGNAWGIMQMRWNHCSDAPEPAVRKVPLADVKRYLPADTPTITPAQRREQLRLRREGAQFRRLW